MTMLWAGAPCLSGRMRPSPSEPSLGGQALQNFLAQFLRLAERFLVFDEDPVQLQRLVRRKLVAQQHVAHVNRIGQGCVFRELFKGGCGTVVVHGLYSIATEWNFSGGEIKRDGSGGGEFDRHLFSRLFGRHSLRRYCYWPALAARAFEPGSGFLADSTRASTASIMAASPSEFLSSPRLDFSK